ncbi:MAG: hydrogenase formation protein HypD, partial [Clostridiales bacterium]|nr:hydrogenase formation protein HypD [Clostridiales bacterium]
FETTLPIYALMLEEIQKKKLRNIQFLFSIKALMPALFWICENEPGIHGFIGPGHVSTILGEKVYEPLCRKYGIPLTIAGFGYEHIVAAVYDLTRQCRNGTCEVHNLYANAVSKEGNKNAAELISKYFIKKSSAWRGLGIINESGYYLTSGYEEYDAGDWEQGTTVLDAPGCMCGSVIIGRKTPADCPLFSTVCTPLAPVGPCMVSNEGACGIWYRNGIKRE